MRRWFAFAAINGALAVIAGAFAAHALRGRLAPDMLEVFDLAARYHIIHALALAVAALAADRLGTSPLRLAAVLFATGIILFSGSLYLLALTGVHHFGFVTPIGGVALIAGWLALTVGALQQRDRGDGADSRG
jgi:uncharacterized membrane protein YgdD (TMEM256/DUF423 family)